MDTASAAVQHVDQLGDIALKISRDWMEILLSIMASNTLVIASFAVASIISAYASVGSAATPRSFVLIMADDISKNALATFIGALIFSTVAVTALKNGCYGSAGIFIIFTMTTLMVRRRHHHLRALGESHRSIGPPRHL